jgi:hypothetical protein
MTPKPTKTTSTAPGGSTLGTPKKSRPVKAQYPIHPGRYAKTWKSTKDPVYLSVGSKKVSKSLNPEITKTKPPLVHRSIIPANHHPDWVFPDAADLVSFDSPTTASFYLEGNHRIVLWMVFPPSAIGLLGMYLASCIPSELILLLRIVESRLRELSLG